MTQKTFGKQLLEIRTTLGLSQTEVAEAAEVSQSYVCQLEQDKFVPSITVVLRLAKALRVPVERLLPTEPELKKRRCAS